MGEAETIYLEAETICLDVTLIFPPFEFIGARYIINIQLHITFHA